MYIIINNTILSSAQLSADVGLSASEAKDARSIIAKTCKVNDIAVSACNPAKYSMSANAGKLWNHCSDNKLLGDLDVFINYYSMGVDAVYPDSADPLFVGEQLSIVIDGGVPAKYAPKVTKAAKPKAKRKRKAAKSTAQPIEKSDTDALMALLSNISDRLDKLESK